ncbi:5'-deoxynucleotidase [Ruminococcaceae bacterium YRB3002]|nr:5'-deoxynucleotidase [Ruminococcaceae bacterium YRB3002]
MNEANENYGFFAMLDRMQYIARWGLMRNSRTENIKEHSFDVAVIAQCLALMYNRNHKDSTIDPYQAAAYGLYHDCTEILTGDLPTPIKYRNKEITKAYKEVESEAAETLVSLLPEDLRTEYLDLLDPQYLGDNGKEMKKIVKAADKIAAYIKCIRERSSGSMEFSSAQETLREAIEKMELPEADEFMERFVPPFGYTLDQLNNG